MNNYLINFSDGVPTQETQDKLNRLLPTISLRDLDNVEDRLYEILFNISKKELKNYKVTFMPNILLQIALHNLTPRIQYGAHLPFDITINTMGESNDLKSRIAKDIIFMHEVGHALLGDYNNKLDKKYGTHFMEKATDEIIKKKMIDVCPNFYDMYRLCRNTHHYNSKEGDFKEFFKDKIQKLEKEWEIYLAKEIKPNIIT